MMKGKNHLLVTFAIMIFFVFLTYKFFFSELNMLIIGFCVVAIMIGSILPDADIEDGKSKVFFVFFPIAILVRLLEYPLAVILKKPARHRGVLHSHSGIVFSSLAVAIILSATLYLVSALSVIAALYLYILILLSQELHLLEDAFSDHLIYIMIIVALAAISYFFYKPF